MHRQMLVAKEACTAEFSGKVDPNNLLIRYYTLMEETNRVITVSTSLGVFRRMKVSMAYHSHTSLLHPHGEPFPFAQRDAI